MLLLQIFWLFTRVALFSWGGGPASMALMQRETITAGWITPPEFADALALGNALPGPIAPQVSAYIGYKIDGMWGAVAAVCGTVVPTTVLMLIMIVFFFGFKNSQTIKAILVAVRPVIIGLLLWTTFDLADSVFGFKSSGLKAAVVQGWDKFLIALAAFGLLSFTKINPVFIILGAAILGFFIYR